MLRTHQEQETSPHRPIAVHGHRKPDRSLVIALIEQRLTEFPADSLRRQILEHMIQRARAD